MSKFSIRDLSQLSDIKAPTIRMWEQRYGFINPKRTDTNIRYYDDDDLKLILNVALLNQNGFKISKISKMSHIEIKKEVTRITDIISNHTDQIQAMILAMLELDEFQFIRIIQSNISEENLENTILNIIYPFLAKIGILWQTGSITPAHEHFVSNLIRQKIIASIDKIAIKQDDNSDKFLLFLPEGELHEISLLFSDYLIKNRGFRSIYLGQSVPIGDLKKIHEHHTPKYLLTIITSKVNDFNTQKYIDELCLSFPDSRIFLAGTQIVAQGLIIPQNAIIIYNPHDLITALSTL